MEKKTIILDMHVEKSELASANGNPNKIFKIIYGSERRDLFRKYAQEQHRFPVEEDEFGKTDFNDINTWVKPIPGFGKNEYYNPSEFDAYVEKIKKEDESREEGRNMAMTQEQIQAEEEAARIRNEQNIERNTEKTVKLKEGSGIEYLGIGGKYRIYAVTSPEGAQQFAVPSSMSNVKGWCITGGKGPKWQWGGNSHFSSEASRTTNRTFYIFEAANIADSWCVYILKSSSGAIDGNRPSLGFTDNKNDHNHYGIPNCDVPYEKVPELAEAAENTIHLNGTQQAPSEDTDGFYRFRGRTLLGVLDDTVTELTIPVAFVEIAPNAFSNLHELTSITFGSTLTKIGKFAFLGCLKLKEVNLNSSSLIIEESAFEHCKSLDKINLSGVERILSRTFANCSSLKAVDFSSNLSVIYKEAFLGCSSLTILEIPTTCITIGENAFWGCKNLTIETDFTERPSAWYKNIVNHVKEVKFKEAPEVEETSEENIEENAEETTQDSKDVKVLDVNPKEGESKEDFISRFMSETAEEYPDQKQRFAIANSYWNKKKTTVRDNETYTLWELFKDNNCAGWVIKMSDNPNLCVFSNSNNLGFLEEDEESMSDRVVVDEKIEIKPNLYIYVGSGEDKDVFNSEVFKNTGEELATVEEAINDIKSSWKVDTQDCKKKLLNDSEEVIDTNKKNLKDEELSSEEQEVKEVVSNFSVQEVLQEAKKDLESATTAEDLLNKYEDWIAKISKETQEKHLTISQDEQFENELWKIYNDLYEKM